MVKRNIVEIDEDKCDGCGLCIPDCPEGALQVIDGKARLVSDLFCDGLGACLKTCPEGAMQVVEREAEPYEERKVMENIVKKGPNTIKAHLEHLKEHGETAFLKEATEFLKEKGIENPIKEPLGCGCVGSMVKEIKVEECTNESDDNCQTRQKSELRQWPIQLNLVPPNAPYFEGSDLLIAADCVPFANANFHSDYLKDKTLLIGCPKLDDARHYQEKLTEIFKANEIKSITVMHMEVPCCFGLKQLVEGALSESGKEIPLTNTIISLNGEEK